MHVVDGEHRACKISTGLEVALRHCHRARNDTRMQSSTSASRTQLWQCYEAGERTEQ